MLVSSKSIAVKQLNNFKKIDVSILKTDAILNKSKLILSLNKEQIRVGLNPSGNQFFPYSSTEYSDYKANLSSYKAPLSIPDLWVTGDFQNAMFLKIDGNNVIIDSTDSKSMKLKAKYDPFDLMPKNQKVATTKVTNEYFKKIHEKINI